MEKRLAKSMTTITFKENIALEKTEFESLQSFMLYVEEQKESTPLTDEHKTILDERLAAHKANPDEGLTLEEMKAQFTRRNR